VAGDEKPPRSLSGDPLHRDDPNDQNLDAAKSSFGRRLRKRSMKTPIAATRPIVPAAIAQTLSGTDAPFQVCACAALVELTPRELEVLRLIARGVSNGEIARELVVGDARVKTHVARIFAKPDLHDRAQAVVLAYESGLVQPGAAASA
jgi:DNA-binding NarL/FixJ family response regulator